MINYQRLFRIYGALAHSFDSFLRMYVFKKQIKGWNRLTAELAKLEQAEDDK